MLNSSFFQACVCAPAYFTWSLLKQKRKENPNLNIKASGSPVPSEYTGSIQHAGDDVQAS